MAECLVMTLEDEQAHGSQSPGALSELVAKRAAYVDEIRRTGRLIDSGRIHPSNEGKRIRREGDQLQVRDGPFGHQATALGSYYRDEASNLDQGVVLAAQAPVLPGDEVEVRRLMGTVVVDGETQADKIFACGVLGRADTEEAWVKVMDRIDGEARVHVQEASFLGGLRLDPPTSGRRIATRGEKRAMFDGPFLETKEVIGGVFFLQMPSIHDVVRCACATCFVVHGILEIRELWRA